MTDQKPKLQIDWLRTIGGALAAVTTAVLLSTLGAAGTLIGAALGSVAVTVSTQLYTQGLARSRETMAKAQETALLKVGIAQAEVRRAGRRQDDTRALDAHLEHADEQLAEAKSDLGDASPAQPGLKDRVLLLPWKRIALLALATFVVVVIVIGGFERLAGRSVSSYTGGSSRDSGSIVPGVNSTSKDPKPGQKTDIENKPDSSGTVSPSSEATPSATPSSATVPTPAPTPAPSSAAPTPAPSATTTPTPTPSPTPAPTASASPTR